MPAASRGTIYLQKGSKNWFVKFYVDGQLKRETTGTPNRDDLPLWKETAHALRAWHALRDAPRCQTFFVSLRGVPLTRAGFEYILKRHVATARAKEPSLGTKRVSPHVLRHTCAMHTLQATHDIRKVALWLGHASIQTTEIYVRADPHETLAAIEAIVPPSLRRGRFRAPDQLLELLHGRLSPKRNKSMTSL